MTKVWYRVRDKVAEHQTSFRIPIGIILLRLRGAFTVLPVPLSEPK
jgi:hypothetical protein